MRTTLTTTRWTSCSRRNVDDGIANRDINGRTFGARRDLPQITALARADWAYLRDSLGLRGAELERWQLESVLRRTAQAVGQWVGTNHEDAPGGTAAQFSSLSTGAGRPSRRRTTPSPPDHAHPPRHSSLPPVWSQRRRALSEQTAVALAAEDTRHRPDPHASPPRRAWPSSSPANATASTC